MPTRLSAYGISADDIKKVADRFAVRGVMLGENRDIGAEQVGEILELRL
jgi:alcohol dehydrogenase YqhD (iron-dependent ADH family)